MIFSQLRSVLNYSPPKEMTVSFLGRFVARCRWLCSGESLGEAAPRPPHGPGLIEFFLKPGRLPTPDEALPAAAAGARPPFLTWLVSREQLPRPEAVQASDAPTPRVES